MGAHTLVGAATRTIVVADETEFVRERFRSALEDAGHRVLLAADRAALLAHVKKAERHIDLVVLDVRLSASSATGLVKQLQKLLPQDTVIVAFSGTVGSADAVHDLAELRMTAFVNEYTAEHNIARALHPFLGGDAAYRRSSPRVALGTAVTFRLGHTISTAVTLNIGRGGVAIRSTNPLPCESVVQLRLRIPGAGREVEATARVVWQDPRLGMGLQFERISPEHQRLIDAFVDSNFFANRKG